MCFHSGFRKVHVSADHLLMWLRQNPISQMQEIQQLMSSDCLKAKESIPSQDINEPLADKEAQKLAEFDAQVRKSIEQFEAGLGKTFTDKEGFLDYLRKL